MYMNYKKQNGLIFIVSALLYIFNRHTKFHIPNEGALKYIWDYNFTDFLCQIVFFSLLNLVLELFDKKGVYEPKTMVGLGLLCVFYWEIVVLYIRSGTVFDIYDCVAYFLGGFAYYVLLKAIRKSNRLVYDNKEK